MKRMLKSLLRRLGFEVVRYPFLAPAESDKVSDLTPGERKIIAAARPFTMTSVERLAALLNSVNYVVANKIPGNVAECGVWRGGSMVAVALALQGLQDTNRSLFLYDTFEGMPPPSNADNRWDGVPAEALLKQDVKGTGVWCHASLEDVRANLTSTGYPLNKIHFIKGKVEDTIPAALPGSLAILRLDTDWYESTRHELCHLFPLLHPRGVLIIDDYGFWQGARKAVDEYFKGKLVYLHRIDPTGRILAGAGRLD